MNNRIKVFRAEYDMTQEDLASKCGVTRQTIIAVEKNKYTPSLELAFKIANVFKQPIEKIFNYKG
ncbi:MAG: helix-turn-helix transcriptional regulator [Atribacterota bacterium]|nr:helix-turn-helix transcriptional regulator [Atribacterota bacterium]